jgi:hypothetical protein
LRDALAGLRSHGREKRWSLFWMQAVFAVINIVGIVRWLA